MASWQDAQAITSGLNQGINNASDIYQQGLNRALKQKQQDIEQQQYAQQHAPVDIQDLINTTQDPETKAALQAKIQGSGPASPVVQQDTSQAPGLGGLMQGVTPSQSSNGVTSLPQATAALYRQGGEEAIAARQKAAELQQKTEYDKTLGRAALLRGGGAYYNATGQQLFPGAAPQAPTPAPGGPGPASGIPDSQPEPTLSPRQQMMQNNNFKTVASQLSSSRQLPDIKQAYADRYQAGKIDALKKRIGDLDGGTAAQNAILATEVSKIAKGGASTVQELNAIEPGTLRGKAATAWGNLTNNPTSQNAGAFMKQLTDYGDDIGQNAQKTIDAGIGKTIETWKPKISKSDYNNLREIHLGIPNPANASAKNETASVTPAAPAALNASQKRIVAAAPPAPQGYANLFKGGQAFHVPVGNVDKAKAQGYSESP